MEMMKMTPVEAGEFPAMLEKIIDVIAFTIQLVHCCRK